MASITETIDEASLRTWVAAQTRMAELADRVKNEEAGQSTAEYVGVVILVAAILAVVISNGDTIGERLSNLIDTSIDKISNAAGGT